MACGPEGSAVLCDAVPKAFQILGCNLLSGLPLRLLWSTLIYPLTPYSSTPPEPPIRLLPLQSRSCMLARRYNRCPEHRLKIPCRRNPEFGVVWSASSSTEPDLSIIFPFIPSLSYVVLTGRLFGSLCPVTALPGVGTYQSRPVPTTVFHRYQSHICELSCLWTAEIHCSNFEFHSPHG